jgi:hypothetical protein
MLGPIANGFVQVVFGLLLGAGISIFGQVTGIRAIPEQEPGETFWGSVLRRQRDENRLLGNLPRSALLTEVAMGVLVAILLLLLFLTPVEMRWVPFLLGMAGGYGALEGLRSLSRSRVYRPLDSLAERVFGKSAPPSPAHPAPPPPQPAGPVT